MTAAPVVVVAAARIAAAAFNQAAHRLQRHCLASSIEALCNPLSRRCRRRLRRRRRTRRATSDLVHSHPGRIATTPCHSVGQAAMPHTVRPMQPPKLRQSRQCCRHQPLPEWTFGLPGTSGSLDVSQECSPRQTAARTAPPHAAPTGPRRRSPAFQRPPPQSTDPTCKPTDPALPCQSTGQSAPPPSCCRSC